MSAQHVISGIDAALLEYQGTNGGVNKCQWILCNFKDNPDFQAISDSEDILQYIIDKSNYDYECYGETVCEN